MLTIVFLEYIFAIRIRREKKGYKLGMLTFKIEHDYSESRVTSY